MSTYTPNPKAMDWSDGTTRKRICDRAVLGAMLPWILSNHGKITRASFPGTDWAEETAMVQICPSRTFQLVGFEQNRDVFDEASSQVKRIHKENRNVSDITLLGPTSFAKSCALNSIEQEMFDYVYFDWMGTWNEDKMLDLSIVFSRRMLKTQSFLRLTYCLNRLSAEANKCAMDNIKWCPEFDFGSPPGDTDNYIAKTRGVVGTINRMAFGSYRRPINVEHFSVYNSGTTGRTPEISLLLSMGVPENKSLNNSIRHDDEIFEDE